MPNVCVRTPCLAASWHWQLGKHLILHLNRLRGDVKLLDQLASPITLDVPLVGRRARRAGAPQAPATRKFNLLAIVAHVGASARVGHFIAYLRVRGPADTALWLRCDDSVVTPVSLDAVATGGASGDAYLLWCVSVCQRVSLTGRHQKVVRVLMMPAPLGIMRAHPPTHTHTLAPVQVRPGGGNGSTPVTVALASPPWRSPKSTSPVPGPGPGCSPQPGQCQWPPTAPSAHPTRGHWQWCAPRAPA
jgi:hypothetical protein